MALLTLSARERELEYQCVDLLPDLEVDVYYEDVLLVSLGDAYSDGMDDWWDGFVSDGYL